LWTVIRRMKIARVIDPSAGVRNKKPQPRHARWSEGEAVRLVKAAWRRGRHGLACITAVAWDTQFSPIDVRGRRLFLSTGRGRTDNGCPTIGTLSRQTEHLVSVYQKHLTPSFTRMRFCFAIGRSRCIEKTCRPTISRQHAQFVLPATNRRLKTCARQEL
jgi:hypothetical protein